LRPADAKKSKRAQICAHTCPKMKTANQSKKERNKMKEQKEKSKLKYIFSFILILCLIYVFYLLITNMYFEMFKLNRKEETEKYTLERLNRRETNKK
jgi:uncharacterized membrane protein